MSDDCGSPLGLLVVPEVNAINAGLAGSAANVPVISWIFTSASKLSPTPRIGTSAQISELYVIRPNCSAVMKNVRLGAGEDVAQIPLGRRSGRSAPRPAPRNADAQNVAAASTQFGS